MLKLFIINTLVSMHIMLFSYVWKKRTF